MRSTIFKKRSVIALAVVAACAVAPVYVAEIVMTVRPHFAAATPMWSLAEASVENKERIGQLAARAEVAADMRRSGDVLAQMRSDGREVVPAHPIVPSERVDAGLVPLGGISNRTTLLCNESGQFVSYKSDEHGFRNPPGIWRSRRLDLAVVGQSFAQGYCVDDGNSFVDLLRSQYSAVLNLGWSGQGAMLQLGAIKEYLTRYSPRVVLWVFQEGLDLQELRTETTLPVAQRYLEHGFTQRLLDRQSEIDTVLLDDAARRAGHQEPPAEIPSFAQRAEPVLKLWHLRTWLNAAMAVDDAREVDLLEQAGLQPLRQPLQQARDISAGWGGKLYIVYLPSWARYRYQASALDRQRAVVLKLAESLKIPVIDADGAFRREHDALSLFPFREFGHYNEKGNRVVAQAIQSALEGTPDVSVPASEKTSGVTD